MKRLLGSTFNCYSKNLFFLGAPGVGSEIFASQTSAVYGVHHVSCSEIVRTEIREETKLGELFKPYVEACALVPDDLIIPLLINELEDLSGKDTIISGFPRTMLQLESLKENGYVEGQDFHFVNLLKDEVSPPPPYYDFAMKELEDYYGSTGTVIEAFKEIGEYSEFYVACEPRGVSEFVDTMGDFFDAKPVFQDSNQDVANKDMCLIGNCAGLDSYHFEYVMPKIFEIFAPAIDFKMWFHVNPDLRTITVTNMELNGEQEVMAIPPASQTAVAKSFPYKGFDCNNSTYHLWFDISGDIVDFIKSKIPVPILDIQVCYKWWNSEPARNYFYFQVDAPKIGKMWQNVEILKD